MFAKHLFYLFVRTLKCLNRLMLKSGGTKPGSYAYEYLRLISKTEGKMRTRCRKADSLQESEACLDMSHVPQRLVPAQDLKECAICGRHFTSNRINAHEAVCQKASSITRKRFDVSQQRVKGTEVEEFAKRAAKNNCPEKPPKNSPCALSTNWRWKHEDLIKKVNEAKGRSKTKHQVNNLPLPPPMDSEADHVQCPHCLRPFNQVSAARHINACANRMCKSNSKTNMNDPKAKSSQPIFE